MPKLGLTTSLGSSGLTTPGIVTDGLVMKHMYPAGAVQKLSDGAAYFDGAQDYIKIKNSSSDLFTLGTSDFAWTGWVNYGDITSKKIFDAAESDDGFFIYIGGSGEIRVRVCDAVGDFTTDLRSTGWRHVAVNFDRSGNATCYIDGVLEVDTINISGEVSDDAGCADDITIGINNNETSEDYTGYLCNIGVWKRLLTQPEIKSIMWKQYADLTTGEKSSLVSFWNLDNNLTTQGSSSWVADEADTTFGSNVTPTWTSSNGAVIDGQTITLGSSGVVSAAATISPVGVYKVNVTVTGYTGSGNIEMPWDGGGNSNMRVSANGTYEFYEASGDTSWAVYAADGVGGTITINSITKANGNIGELL